ncbi:Cytochrome c oxidase subunit CcoP [hydrothermal vent metagenome]|uniref:Cytochrome c oxidase subunit CcoP n=1 Tax=hydrothermal vent metagenome TaxID=652676 RepID=A0A3B1AC69_9ZZZZ
MDRTLFSFILLITASLFVSSCSKQDDESEASNNTSQTVMTKTSSAPIKIDPALAAEGEALYNQNCVFCHQDDAIGKPGFAPSLTNQEFLSASSDQFLMGTIRDGRAGTGMPPFSHLGRKQVEAIVAFLRAHAKVPNRSVEIDAQPASHGDERLGQFWFDSICSTCHGPNGDGYAAGGTGTAIGKASFLDKVTDGFIRTTIKEGRTNTRMIGYSGPAAMADLSDGDVDDIIAYLRTVPSR